MKENNNVCFLPVYINKTKLLDINSILFDGYSEFSEINFQSEEKNSSGNKSKVSAGAGMSIFSLGSHLESDKLLNSGTASTVMLKKIQTSSSLLANTIRMLNEKGIIKNFPKKAGELIEIEGIFKNNSMIDFVEQICDMTNLAKIADKLSDNNSDSTSSTKKSGYRDISDQMNSFKQMLTSKTSVCKSELVCEKEDVIYVIHISENSLYNCDLRDIYNKELTFFGQVKGIYDKYKFFADTPLSKFNPLQLEGFIKGLEPMINNGIYDIEFELMTNNNGKSVVELDIIAIYRNVKGEDVNG